MTTPSGYSSMRSEDLHIRVALSRQKWAGGLLSTHGVAPLRCHSARTEQWRSSTYRPELSAPLAASKSTARKEPPSSSNRVSTSPTEPCTNTCAHESASTIMICRATRTHTRTLKLAHNVPIHQHALDESRPAWRRTAPTKEKPARDNMRLQRFEPGAAVKLILDEARGEFQAGEQLLKLPGAAHTLTGLCPLAALSLLGTPIRPMPKQLLHGLPPVRSPS